MKYLFVLFCLLVLCACTETNKDRIIHLVKEWEGKEITLPQNIVFTQYGIDTLDYQLPSSDYKVISYNDSIGCTSCKLQFSRWKVLIHEMDSISGISIPFLFIFHPKGVWGASELNHLMKRDHFDYPVWIDRNDEFNIMNKLPEESILHTLLVDRQNKVLAMGDPFQNPRVRELYLKLIHKNIVQNIASSPMVEVAVEHAIMDLGKFDWRTSKEVSFRLNNVGKERLVINDVVASCGCISVDYQRTPIEVGKETLLKVIYSAEKPEFFNKKITVYTNLKTPLYLTVKGHAN